MKSNIKFSLLFSVFTLLIAQESFAQYKTRLWNSFSVGAPLTENLSIKASYMKSLDLSSPQLETSFNWYSLKLGYQIDKDWSVDFGTAWMNLPGSGRTTNRIFAEGNHRIKLNKKFSLRNSLQVERHNDQEERFDGPVLGIGAHLVEHGVLSRMVVGSRCGPLGPIRTGRGCARS